MTGAPPSLANGMANETEDTSGLIESSEDSEKMPPEEMNETLQVVDDDDVSLESQNSSADNKDFEDGEVYSQPLVDTVPTSNNVPSTILSSASNSVMTLESNLSVTQNPDYAYDDDVPFSYYAPLQTKERTAPLIDHRKSKAQKKKEKKERKNEIKKERQEAQQQKKEQQEKVQKERGQQDKVEPEKDLESPKVDPTNDDHVVPNYSLLYSMAGLAVAPTEPHATPYTNPSFLHDDAYDGYAELVDDDDDNFDDDFRIERLESIKLQKSKRRSIKLHDPPPAISSKKKSSSGSSSSSSGGSSSSSGKDNKKKSKKKRGRRADYEEIKEEDEHDTTEAENDEKTPAHTTKPPKDIEARVEAIFTNKELILEEFDGYIEKVDAEKKQLEKMLQEQHRGRSDSVSNKKNRGRSRSVGKPHLHHGRSHSAGANTTTEDRSKSVKRGRRPNKGATAVPKQSLDNTLEVVLGGTSKPHAERRPVQRSKSDYLVKHVKNFTKTLNRQTRNKTGSDPPEVVSGKERETTAKSEQLALDDKVERPTAVSKPSRQRSGSFSELEGKMHSDKQSSDTDKKTKPSKSEEESGTKAKTKEKKDKKEKLENVTLDDSVERPLSISKDLRRQSNSYSKLEGVKSAQPVPADHETNDDKLKLSAKTLQALSGDIVGKSSSKSKSSQKEKKENFDALALEDSIERPLSISKNLRKTSASYSDLEGTKTAEDISSLNQSSKNEKMKLSPKTLLALSEDIVSKPSSKMKLSKKKDDSADKPLSLSKGFSFSEADGAKRSSPSLISLSRVFETGATKVKASITRAKETGQKLAKGLSTSEHTSSSAMKSATSSKEEPNDLDDEKPVEPKHGEAHKDDEVPLAPPSPERPKVRASYPNHSSTSRLVPEDDDDDLGALPTELVRSASLDATKQISKTNAESPSTKADRKKQSPRVGDHKRSKSPKKTQHKRSKSPSSQLKAIADEGISTSVHGDGGGKGKKKFSRTSSGDVIPGSAEDGGGDAGKSKKKVSRTSSGDLLPVTIDDDGGDAGKSKKKVSRTSSGDLLPSSVHDGDGGKGKKKISRTKSSLNKTGKRSSESAKKAECDNADDGKKTSGSAKERRRKEGEESNDGDADKNESKETDNADDGKEKKKETSGAAKERARKEVEETVDSDLDSDLESVGEFIRTSLSSIKKPSSKRKSESDKGTKKQDPPGFAEQPPHRNTHSGESLNFSFNFDELPEVDGMDEKLKKSSSPNIPNPDISSPSRKVKKSTDNKKHGLSATMH